jgi:SAM-dependent methyltransferase
MGSMMHMMLVPIIVSIFTYISLSWKRLLAKFRHSESAEEPPPGTRGLVWNRHHDRIMWFRLLLFSGKRHKFLQLRQKTADLARLQPGERVLDVGCGAGALAMIAKQRVGATGHVSGIDPSMGQITRARRRAERAGLYVDFQLGVIEHLTFPDHSFDVVLSSAMMHHLPDDLKRQGLREIARVLKPGGRLLVLDFKRQEMPSAKKAHRAHPGPWNSGIQDQPAMMREAGFSQIETGEVEAPKGLPEIGFVLGRTSPSPEENNMSHSEAEKYEAKDVNEMMK